MQNISRQEKLVQYANDYAELAAFLKTLSKEQIAYKPGPDKWSAHEIMVHIADAEANSYVRVRRAVAEPGGTVMPYEQDIWVKELNYAGLDMAEHLELFRLLRKLNHDLVKDLPEEKWQNQYSHPQYGMVNLDSWLDIYAKHVSGHIAQIKRNMDAMEA